MPRLFCCLLLVALAGCGFTPSANLTPISDIVTPAPQTYAQPNNDVRSYIVNTPLISSRDTCCHNVRVSVVMPASVFAATPKTWEQADSNFQFDLEYGYYVGRTQGLSSIGQNMMNHSCFPTVGATVTCHWTFSLVRATTVLLATGELMHPNAHFIGCINATNLPIANRELTLTILPKTGNLYGCHLYRKIVDSWPPYHPPLPSPSPSPTPSASPTPSTSPSPTPSTTPTP